MKQHLLSSSRLCCSIQQLENVLLQQLVLSSCSLRCCDEDQCQLLGEAGGGGGAGGVWSTGT